jgi:hypothetical protein
MGYRAYAIALIILTFVGPAVPASSVDMSKLIGAWSYVESYLVFPDGTRREQYSANPQGIFTILPNGSYSHIIMRDDLPKIASGSNQEMTNEEAQTIAKGALSHFGSYTIDKKAGAFTVTIEHSDFPNFDGIKQTRRVVELNNTTLRYINDTTNVGGGTKVHATLKRVWGLQEYKR